MGTRVYGASDDLIEVEGDLKGEVACYGTYDRKMGVLVVFSDDTIIEVKYGKADTAVWGITLIKQGSFFDRIEPCNDENADPHSDVLHFKDGIKWAYAAIEWERVK